MLKEFRDFIARGNVLDLAIAVLIGAAFGSVVESFTKDILTPVIGAFGKVDFSNIYVPLGGPHYPTLAEAKAHRSSSSSGDRPFPGSTSRSPRSWRC